MPTIAFATAHMTPDLTTDDRLTMSVLVERGVTVRPAVWIDPHVEWQQFDAVVVRSC